MSGLESEKSLHFPIKTDLVTNYSKQLQHVFVLNSFFDDMRPVQRVVKVHQNHILGVKIKLLKATVDN